MLLKALYIYVTEPFTEGFLILFTLLSTLSYSEWSKWQLFKRVALGRLDGLAAGHKLLMRLSFGNLESMIRHSERGSLLEDINEQARSQQTDNAASGDTQVIRLCQMSHKTMLKLVIPRRLFIVKVTLLSFLHRTKCRGMTVMEEWHAQKVQMEDKTGTMPSS